MIESQRIASVFARKGCAPIQIWVPDVRSERFDDEARRQSRLVGAADAHSDDQAFVEAISLDDE